MPDNQIDLANYARQVFRGTAPSLESAGFPGSQQLEAASGALDSVLNDRWMNTEQKAVLEAIVLPKFRPALFIRQDTFEDPADPWGHLALEKDALKPVIQAIGRVEVQKIDGPFGGTGFFVAPGVIMTNRHVAELFTYGLGAAKKLKFIPGRLPSLDTAKEVAPAAGMTFQVVKPLMIHPQWDMALLEVKADDPGRPLPKILTLAGAAPNGGEWTDREVVVIGYPYFSAGHDPALLKEVFGGVHGVKRIQPGKLMDGAFEDISSFGHIVQAIRHDASTLGGNSGSAVIDLETKEVLALHFSGAYLKANYAVPMWELSKDPRIVDLGVQFSPKPPSDQPRTPDTGGPAWLKQWKGREEIVVSSTPATPAKTESEAPAPLAAQQSLLFDPGWFERYSDIELARLYQRDPEGMRQLIASSFSLDEQQDLMDTLLSAATVESVPEAAVDPDLPEIVLLPGIMGSHLDAPRRLRSWLNPLTLPLSNLYRELALDQNGNDPNGLSPDGLVSSAYATAARRWRNQGFMVHEFSYDWRKPLSNAAASLDRFLRNRRRERPAARFALVAHSMGCLVSSVYSLQTPDWRDYVRQAVFCGGPLGGSFAIMEMLSGEWPSVVKMAKVSLATSLDEIRRMGSTFPGAIEMLPHPALFNSINNGGPDIEELYRSSVYASFAQPSPDWLVASRALKNRLREAPVLGRTTCLVTIDIPTACSFVKKNALAVHSSAAVRGDGTVAAKSAVVDGVPAYQVTKSHGDLLLDEEVIAAVPALLRGQPLMLSEVTAETIAAPLPEASPKAEAADALDKKAAAVQERMRNGLSTTSDLRWILSNE